MNLGQIRTAVREYLNEPFAAFWSDAALNIWINAAVPKCANLIKNVSRYHFTTRATFQTVVGHGYYQLPTNLKDLKYATMISTDDQELPLTRAPWPNPIAFTESVVGGNVVTDSSNDGVTGYWVVGGSMRLVPVPSSVFTIRLYYEARFNPLVADTDTPGFDSDYHDMAAIWAAINARVKNSESSQDLGMLWGIRKEDLIQDVFHRFPMPAQEVEAYMQGLP